MARQDQVAADGASTDLAAADLLTGFSLGAPLPESISKGKVDLLTLHHDHCLLNCSGG
jgi:hypothetical protein